MPLEFAIEREFLTKKNENLVLCVGGDKYDRQNKPMLVPLLVSAAVVRGSMPAAYTLELALLHVDRIDGRVPFHSASG